MNIVISLGGSLLTKELTHGHFSKYADAIKDLSKDHNIAVVCVGITSSSSRCMPYIVEMVE